MGTGAASSLGPLGGMDPASPLGTLVGWTWHPPGAACSITIWGLVGSLKNKEEANLHCWRKAAAFLLGL